VLGAAMALAGAAAASGAQGAPRVAPAPPSVAPSADARVLPAVDADARAGDVRVVRVPRPAPLVDRDVSYTLRTEDATVRLISRASGALKAGRDDGITVGFAVPAVARAGLVQAALVEWVAGRDTLATPIQLTVLPAPGVRIAARQELIGTRAGTTARAALIVSNSGNARANVLFQVVAPSGWRARVAGPEPLVLEVGQAREVVLEARAPLGAAEGEYALQVRATVDDATAEAGVVVRVSEGAFGSRSDQPTVLLSAAYAGASEGDPTAAFGAELDGIVAPGVTAIGRVNLFNGDPLGVSARSLGRLGYAPRSSFVHLDADRWSASGGLIGSTRNTLAGTAFAGTGVAGRLRDDTWRGGALAARPFNTQDGGLFATADASRRVWRGWAGVAGSRLDDGRPDGRQVTTALTSYDLPWRRGGATLEGGFRDAAETRGAGWLAHVEHRERDWSVGFTASHAPGGTMSFARAEDELQADVFRRLGPVSLAAAGWSLRDRATASQRTTNQGWSVSPGVALGRIGALMFDLRSFDFEQVTGVGTIGTGERFASASFTTSLGPLSATATGGRGEVTRRTVLDDGLSVETDAPRTAASGNLTLSTRAGQLAVNGGLERVGAGVGIPSEQVSYGVFVDDVPLVPGWVWLRADATRTELTATGATLASYVAGVQVRLTRDLRLTVDAERSDFLRTLSGTTPWIYALRLERGVALRGVPGAARSGVVFADVNGNGRQDDYERGVSGIVVTSGGRATTTDARGRYPAAGGDNAPVHVDVRSLPAGWVVAPGPPARGAATIAIVPTAPVTVRLVIDPTDVVDPSRLQPARAILTLRDERGRVWTALPDADGSARFDALPPGVYEVGADLTQVGEPLVLPPAPAVVRVEGGARPIVVTLTVRGRPVRQLAPRAPRRISSGGGTQ
jgi:hypothetical protein